MVQLTDKRKVFVEEYLRCWNGTEAARIAGYAYPRQEASRLLSNADIQEIVSERIAEVSMSAEEVLVRLAQQARGVPPGFIEIKAGLPFLNWQALEDAELTHLVKKIKYNNNGQPEVEFYDAQTALIQLGRHHSLFTDKSEADIAMRIEVSYIDEPPGTMMMKRASADTEEGDIDD